MAVNLGKLKHMILYIAGHPDVTTLGVTKLYKLIYFADVAHLRATGHTITGSDYLKYPHGPVPSRAKMALKDLTQHRQVKSETIPLGPDLSLGKLTALSAPNPAIFTKEEWDTLERIINTYGRETAQALSERSHLEPAWYWAEDRKKLDSELMLYGATEDPDGL